jgi:hypothetical protein
MRSERKEGGRQTRGKVLLYPWNSEVVGKAVAIV